jgi:hypothetical protein
VSETTKETNHLRLLDYLLDKQCARCGIKDLRVLTFDHKNAATKSATVSTLVHKGHSWDIVMKEIKKCSILCLSCHTIVECERAGEHSRRQVYWEENQQGKT